MAFELTIVYRDHQNRHRGPEGQPVDLLDIAVDKKRPGDAACAVQIDDPDYGDRCDRHE